MLRNLMLVLILMLATSACKPRSVMMASTPDGPPEYQQGWKDGCESGLSTYGNSYYKTFYHFKQDLTLVKNETYYRTWQDAFNYCRHFTKANLAHGFTAAGGGFNPRSSDPAFDLRDQRDVTRDGLGFPGSKGIQLPSWGDEVEEEDTLGKALWGNSW